MVDPNTPGVVKVGSTPSAPSDVAMTRVLSLQDAVYFSDRTVAERFVHDSLDEFRASSDPETFQVPVETALAALSAAMDRLVGTREGGQPQPAIIPAPVTIPVPVEALAVKYPQPPPPEVAAKPSLGKQIRLVLILSTLLTGLFMLVIPTAVQFYRSRFAQTPVETAATVDSAGAEKDAEPATQKTPGRTVTTPGARRAAGKKVASAAATAAAVVPPKPTAPVIRSGDSTTPAPSKRLEAAAAPEPTPPNQITGEELREHFAWDKTKATAAFKDGVLRVADIVTKVGKKDLSFRKIKCKFDAPPPSGIEAGASVTVEGTVKGKGFWTGTITLEHCRVL